jgi:hypothetical protein
VVEKWSLAQLVVMVMDLTGLAIQPVSKNRGQKRMLCGYGFLADRTQM